MPTSSIRKNFVIEGKEQVEMFINAIEMSENNYSAKISVNARQIKVPEELRKLMAKRKKYKEGKEKEE